MYEYFVIGKIVNVHGIRGEVRVIPTTDDIERFNLLKEVNIYIKDRFIIYEIENIRYHKQFVLLKLKGVDNMTDAEKLKNAKIKIEKKFAISCEDNEYYIGDLYGIDVFTDELEYLGVLSDIIFTGANDVYLIKNNKDEILIPAIKQCILDVNVKEKVMKVHLLEGLR